MKTKTSPKLPKQIFRLQPWFVLIISLILILALFTSALYELNQTRREIRNLMGEEAATLMEAISLSGANAIQAFQEIEQLVEEKLFTVAYLVHRLDQQKTLTAQELRDIATESAVHRINIFNKDGVRILSSVPTTMHEVAPSHLDYIQPILQGEKDEMVLGFKESRHPGEQRFAVAIKRGRGGAIVVNVDAREMLEFRRTIGVGRLMQDIGAYPGINYIVLQDYEGILLASKGVTRINSVASDSFLTKAFTRTSISSRMTTIDGKPIFEFVRPFYLAEEAAGLLRIGLNPEHLIQANNRIKRRLIIMSVVIGFVILIVVNFLIINQNYRLVNEAYHRIQSYSKNILEHMTDAVIAIDRDQRIVLFNTAAAQLFKIEATQVIQKTYRTIIPITLEPLEQALQSGAIVRDLEKDIELNDQRTMLSISTSVLTSTDDQIESAFAVIKDLTEKRHLEESLQRREKLTALGQLASGVAHEIRNPLNSIGVIAQRFYQEFKPAEAEEEYQKLAKIVINEVRRINEIIQQFLRFARPPQLNLTQTNLNELMESLILFVTPQARDRKIHIQTDLKPIPSLPLDQNLMKQAFLNILQNAIEAIEASGTIQVNALVDSMQQVRIEIIDNGPGMDQTTRSKIFNLYFTTKPGGTGLGLSLVHQIISQHDGQIEVESEPGKGTKFIILLPLRKYLN